MVTTTCAELVPGSPCTTPLSGNTLDEFKNNIFAHGQQHHPEELKKMSPQEQTKLGQKIEEVYRQKSATPVGR